MTAQIYLQMASAILTGLALLISLGLGNPVRQTSLTEAWTWGLAAQVSWLVSCSVNAFASAGSPLLDQLWLWTAILTLCPLIAALGARRPASRVWNWFIILPLMAVLGWPGFTVICAWPELATLRIQAPACVGFALVTVMGAGNYMGTRFTTPAVLAVLAVLLALLPLTTFLQLDQGSIQVVRAAAGIVFSGAVVCAIRQGLRAGLEESRFDRLWFDFRDTFGIVWSIRIQDRLNLTAEKENWQTRLGPHGFEWELKTSLEQRKSTQDRMEHALRWNLRRFVDPEWIDERLQSPAGEQADESEVTNGN